MLAACETQTRIVRAKPFFAGLPGAQGATEMVGMEQDFRTVLPQFDDYSIREEKPDGSIELKATTGRHLMIHVYTTLMDDERDLFTQQVLSDITRREFRERGKDPREAYDMLRSMEDDIIVLFNRIPYAERMPGMVMEPQGQGVFRVRLRGAEARGLRLVGMDMVMEGGNWKLRWFVPGQG